MPKRKDVASAKKPESVSRTLEETQPAPLEQPQTVGVVSREKFQQVIQGLHDSSTIRNDKGQEVPFSGQTKDIFIDLCEKAYPVVRSMMQSLYDTGHLLSEVRKALKPQKLFVTWIRFSGIPERTAYNYLRVYERFGEHLAQLSHLGIKRLLIASRVPNPVEYVQNHEEAIMAEPAEELEQKVRNLRANQIKKKRGRTPSYLEVGGCKIHPSKDGSKITIVGLPEKRQKEIIEGLKVLLSQPKE
jgi:hypothetical protein